MFSYCKLLSHMFQVGYILCFNDSDIHAIPVGITTLSNTMYKEINTQAGKNISDSQPIKTYSRMFQLLKPLWKYGISTSGFLIGSGVGLTFILFPDDIVSNRQV